MLPLGYYFGLVLLIVPVVWVGFLTDKAEGYAAQVLGPSLILYLLLGWYLFGWKIALANVLLFVLLGNALWRPLRLIGQRLFPREHFRSGFDSEVGQKFLRWRAALRKHLRR